MIARTPARRNVSRLPKRKMSRFKKAVIGAGVAAGLALGTAGTITGVKMHRASVATEERKIAEKKTALVESRIAVRNPDKWARISNIYGWNPKTAEGARRIGFIESVSRATGVAPERVMLTIETNSIENSSVYAWQNRGSDAARQVSSWRAKLPGLTGSDRRYAESQIKKFERIAAQSDSVLGVLSALSNEPEFARQIRDEVLQISGSKHAIEQLVD